MAFTRLPVTVKMQTTCCDDCGNGLEVQWLSQKIVSTSGVAIPSYREAEALLDDWEARHVCEAATPALEAV